MLSDRRIDALDQSGDSPSPHPAVISVSMWAASATARATTRISSHTGYARWVKYPKTASGLRNRIEEVYDLHDKIKPDNSRERRRRNSSC